MTVGTPFSVPLLSDGELSNGVIASCFNGVQFLPGCMSQESRDIDLDGAIEDTIDPDVVDDTLEEMEEPMEALRLQK